jgi:hypothetical protein
MFAPVAVFLSAVTVPLGFYAGERIRSNEGIAGWISREKKGVQLISPAVLVICLGLVVLFRLIIPHSFS